MRDEPGHMLWAGASREMRKAGDGGMKASWKALVSVMLWAMLCGCGSTEKKDQETKGSQEKNQPAAAKEKPSAAKDQAASPVGNASPTDAAATKKPASDGPPVEAAAPGPKPADGAPPVEAAAPELKDGLYARIETSKGDIVARLHFDRVPLTVTNFVGLAEGTVSTEVRGLGKPFYDGLVFHRVVHSYVIQAGCPYGNGKGGPGYAFRDEFQPDLKHDQAGVLSMANSGPNSNGSQFFITHLAAPGLDQKHSVFGQVVQGLDVVNRIEKGDAIKKIVILRVGEQAQAFKADQASFDKLREKSN